MDLSWYVPETYKNDKIKATTKHHKNMLWKREKLHYLHCIQIAHYTYYVQPLERIVFVTHTSVKVWIYDQDNRTSYNMAWLNVMNYDPIEDHYNRFYNKSLNDKKISTKIKSKSARR